MICWDRNIQNEDIDKEIESWVDKINEHSRGFVERWNAAGVRSTSAFIHLKKGSSEEEMWSV